MFIPPLNPGATTDIPVGSNAAQISAPRYAHATAAKILYKYEHTDKALRKQLLLAVYKLFFLSLLHCYVGYITVLTRNILDHLYATYVNISPSNLQENETHFRAPCDANHPINTLINQVETAIEYAADGNIPYSSAQVVATAYQLVF